MPVTGSEVAARAQKYVGTHFHKGEKEQCANFVRDVFTKCGVNLPATSNPSDLHLLPPAERPAPGKPVGAGLADSLAGDDIGARVMSRQQLEPGDIVFERNTYGNYRSGVITHVGIYVGGGRMVHRPTRALPVQISPLSSLFCEARRPRQLQSSANKTVIDLHGGRVSAKLNGAPTQSLTLALDGNWRVFENNKQIQPQYLTVEINNGGTWCKAYAHHGRHEATGMKSCKAAFQGGQLNVHVDGMAVRPSAMRFEVVT